MKGVLLKDFYIAKSNILVTIVSLIVLGFGLSFLLETSALLILAPVASTTAVFISITSDAGSKWNKNVITMPVSRNQIISEKFIFYILLAAAGLMTALIPCIVLMFAGADVTVHSLCLYAAIGMSATLLAGVEKALPHHLSGGMQQRAASAYHVPICLTRKNPRLSS